MAQLELAVCPAPVLAAAGLNQRRHERIPHRSSDALRLAVRPAFGGLRAVLVNVSAGGVGFLAEAPLAEETVVALELRGPVPGEGMGRLAKVRHCRPHPAPADAPWQPRPSALSGLVRRVLGLAPAAPVAAAWLVGCEFDRPLGDAELAELLSLLARP